MSLLQVFLSLSLPWASEVAGWASLALSPGAVVLLMARLTHQPPLPGPQTAADTLGATGKRGVATSRFPTTHTPRSKAKITLRAVTRTSHRLHHDPATRHPLPRAPPELPLSRHQPTCGRPEDAAHRGATQNPVAARAFHRPTGAGDRGGDACDAEPRLDPAAPDRGLSGVRNSTPRSRGTAGSDVQAGAQRGLQEAEAPLGSPCGCGALVPAGQLGSDRCCRLRV